MKPGIAVSPRPSTVWPAAADAGDPSAADDDRALIDHRAIADDHAHVRDDKVLSEQSGRATGAAQDDERGEPEILFHGAYLRRGNRHRSYHLKSPIRPRDQ
jgi:hypothetical protein